MASQEEKRDQRTATDTTPTETASEAAQEAARPTDGAEHAEQLQVAEAEAGWAPPTESGEPDKPSSNTTAGSTPKPRKS